MSFNTSPIRSAHAFRLSWIQLKETSPISRMQLIFISYLIENGHIKGTVSSFTTTGLSWALASQYLQNLRRIDYVTRQGHEWTITDKGRDYYSRFMDQFNTLYRGPFCWK